jgi:hypothetical protein
MFIYVRSTKYRVMSFSNTRRLDPLFPSKWGTCLVQILDQTRSNSRKRGFSLLNKKWKVRKTKDCFNLK